MWEHIVEDDHTGSGMSARMDHTDYRHEEGVRSGYKPMIGVV